MRGKYRNQNTHFYLGESTRLQDTMEVKWFHIRSQRRNWNQSLQLLTKKGQTPTFSFPVKKSQFLQKCYRKIPTTKNTGVVMKPDIQICLSVFFMPIFSSSCSHSQRGSHNVIGAASQCLASVCLFITFFFALHQKNSVVTTQ